LMGCGGLKSSDRVDSQVSDCVAGL
jgi:hypothetical protein